MEDKYIKLSDAKNAIADYIAEQTVSKYGSLEACRDAKFAAQGAMKELDYIPAADVVPKSEVERLEGELIVERTRRENAVDAYHEARQKIAREIFAEIDILGTYNPTLYAELKKKYTEEQI